MRIGVAGPFNPQEVKEYFDSNTKLPVINEMATSVNAYVRGLLKEGHSVTVFTTYSFEGAPYYIDGNNIRVYLISTQFKIHILGRLRMAKRIRECIKKCVDSLDILHAQWTYEFALAIKPFHKKLPLFCSVRDWIPYIFSLAKGFGGKYYWGLSYYIFKKVMRGNEVHLIANSEYTKERILSRYPNKKVEIIPNPFNSENILQERTEYPKDITFISISTSPFTPRKNNAILLEAFARYRKNHQNAKLIVVGAFSEDIKKELNSRNLLNGVELTGRVSHNEVISLIDKANCLIHPALEETFGNILLEGMCRRVLCIGGEASGAVPQVLGYGKYGILCDVTSEESIIWAMEKANEQELFKKIVDESTEYIIREFTEKNVAKKHTELFDRYLKNDI